MQRFAVIVAGGSGTRMGVAQPKQFLFLKGKPILAHTIERFFEADNTINIIVVLSDAGLAMWSEYQETGATIPPHQITLGGKTRTESVKKGLALVPHGALVAIHDAVRPFVTNEIINKSYEIAELKGCAVAAVPLKDSVRRKKGDVFVASNREDYRLVQTPQTFLSSIIIDAYDSLALPDVTDDATVAELADHEITLFEGTYENIKITTPVDLVFAEAILNSRKL
ncbi:MAG: 2-C-methyl-D-erythritol 4-phosphate cytidylyltransferase [Flexibacteraceae bacterium]|jgi:2-C-methyl-D-erythritol 4-phosphate cytidylyltransferase